MSDWYYAADNEQKGPVNESELKADLASKLPPDTLVWKEGMDSWTPANQVPALSFRQPPAPAKVQPPAASAPAPTATKSESPASNNPQSTQPVDLKTLVGTPESLEVSADDAEKNKVFGILAYVPLLFWVPLVAAKDSPFGKYHANQGLALFLTALAISLVITIGTNLPIIGFLFFPVSILADLGLLVLIILGIVNAAAGKCVPLPVIGGIKIIK